MSNKWILSSALLMLSALLIASGYLLLQESLLWTWQSSLLRADWFWWFFLALLLLGIVANLWVFCSGKSFYNVPKKRHFESESQREHRFASQRQEFFRRYGSLFQPLAGKANFYLYADGNHRLLLQLYPDPLLQPGLEQMCSLLQSMLAYQCDTAFVVSLQPMTAQAKIFAREACIQAIDFSALERQLCDDEFMAAAC